MCGIVGGVAQRDVIPILVEGLKRLEYRGYDSAGVAIVDGRSRLERLRVLGKVGVLEASLAEHTLSGTTGIAHTRWATHGEPSTRNAHPHVSHDAVALVHNGIIENHAALRARQRLLGYEFTLRDRHRGRGPPDPFPSPKGQGPLARRPGCPGRA